MANGAKYGNRQKNRCNQKGINYYNSIDNFHFLSKYNFIQHNSSENINMIL